MGLNKDEQLSPGAHPFLQTGSSNILGLNGAEALSIRVMPLWDCFDVDV